MQENLSIDLPESDHPDRARVAEYLQAFAARDLVRCMSFYGDDAVLRFMSATYRGPAAIAEWLTRRFEAEAQLVRVEAIDADGDSIQVDGVVTSKRLRAWRLGNVHGRATIRMADDKIAEMSLSLRSYNPLEGW